MIIYSGTDENGYLGVAPFATEIIKWQNEDNSTCELPDYPIGIYGAVPVILEENNYACGGGFPETAQCVNLITGKNATFNLRHKRVFASSVTTNSQTFVFGGKDNGNDLKSYEIIDTDYVQSEGEMPFSWSSGCSTLINSTTILLAGGRQNGTRWAPQRYRETWFFNWRTEEWTQGPSMIKERQDFGCGLIKSINSVAAFGSFDMIVSPKPGTTEIVKLPGGSFKHGIRQCLFD